MENPKKVGWKERAAALKNLPPVLRLLWESGRSIVAADVALRFFTALVPVGILTVSKIIVDMVVAHVKNTATPFPQSIWMWLGIEFALACAGNIFGRVIGYFDSRLADNFSAEVSLRIMRHSAKLDLTSFEDPVFYDKLERARVQATDRITMLNAIGNLLQQFITLISMSAAVVWFSPLLFLFLVVCVVPGFLGESHFAFLGYSLAFQLTPLRRELDYLRVLGTSKESAKEMKIFGLSGWLQERFNELTQSLIGQKPEQWLVVVSDGAGSSRFWVHSAITGLTRMSLYGLCRVEFPWDRCICLPGRLRRRPIKSRRSSPRSPALRIKRCF